VFAGFGFLGVLLASVFAAEAERMPRLYLADLAGAALGCAAAVPLVSGMGAPAAVMVAAMAMAAAGAWAWASVSPRRAAFGVALVVLLAVAAVKPAFLPEIVTDPVKTMSYRSLTAPPLASAWSPVFRVDVTPAQGGGDDYLVIHHDGLWGSTLRHWDGDPASLTRFDHDERALPFRTLSRAPGNVVIIGAAGGHEILAALHFGSAHIDGVELNPMTVDFVRRRFADYVGHVADHPAVRIVNDEGRSWLTRHTGPFDVVFFVAPDSYAAMNSATSGAFVLSESYLYTVEMIAETLRRLAPDGMLAMQFGEDDFDAQPNRTIRYVTSVRAALRRLGVTDASAHVAIATTKSFGEISTILVSPSPIDGARAAAFAATAANVPHTQVRWLPGRVAAPGPVTTALTLPPAELDAWLAAYPFDVAPVYDDAPFFWHFGRFASFLGWSRHAGHGVMWEASGAGERVLMATLVAATVFAAISLVFPLAVARARRPTAIPRSTVAAYFSVLGAGFMLFEVALIQKLALILGYPTYSLTVTLMSLLVAAGVGSVTSERWPDVRAAAPWLALAVVVLAAVYAVGLDAITPAVLPLPLAARIGVAIAATLPLGFVLGTFLPLGVRCLARRVDDPAPLVAWAWATNGFFSVIGSVATTILAMTVGFRLVFCVAAATYLIAVWLLTRLAPR
jgi:spermidine synthase